MNKLSILLIALMVISVGFLSGCTKVGDVAEDGATCCVLGVIGIIFFILLSC